jgi:hypothetical protein
MITKTAAVLFLLASSLGATTLTVSVDATQMPWNWTETGLNSNFRFGVLNGSMPVVIDASNGISFAPGGTIILTYLSGDTSSCQGCPNVDANGWTASLADHNQGSSRTYYPSAYMSPYPIYLMALVGTFADSSGAIVGSPFLVGDGSKTLTIPTGAARLQLGVNDDDFADNSGKLQVAVSEEAVGAPEPGAIWLLSIGLAITIIVNRLRRLHHNG